MTLSMNSGRGLGFAQGPPIRQGKPSSARLGNLRRHRIVLRHAAARAGVREHSRRVHPAVDMFGRFTDMLDAAQRAKAFGLEEADAERRVLQRRARDARSADVPRSRRSAGPRALLGEGRAHRSPARQRPEGRPRAVPRWAGEMRHHLVLADRSYESRRQETGSFHGSSFELPDHRPLRLRRRSLTPGSHPGLRSLRRARDHRLRATRRAASHRSRPDAGGAAARPPGGDRVSLDRWTDVLFRMQPPLLGRQLSA